MNHLRAAYLGPPGTFSHEAAVKFFHPGFDLVPGGTATEVMRLYREERVDQAILAVDTSIGGTVGANLDEIADLPSVRIIGETRLAVHHHLMARPAASVDAIKTVLAHPKAFEECDVWLARHLPDAPRIPAASSAVAAQKAGADPAGGTAAIASKTASDLYGLKILADHIENSPLNTTRFWIFGRELPPPTAHDRTTLLVRGDLNAVLARLMKAQIRILSLYERPSGGELDARLYFLDLEGHRQDPPLFRFLSDFPEGRFLGSYPH